MKKIVHVVGTGTIGEPLLGLFTDFRDRMGIDEVTFHKRTPLASDRAKLNHLIQRGAKLAVDEDVRSEFEKLGHEVSFESREALERATVVLDCTPAGNENKEKYYENLSGPKGFLAQGSEFGFGKPYARGINDETLVPGEDRFVQVVSCNTHNITTLIKTAHLAEAFHLKYEVHHGGNSLNNVANLHVIMAIRNCEFFEVLLPDGAQKYGLAQDITVDSKGLVHAPTGPGLGAAIDFDLIERKKVGTLS